MTDNTPKPERSLVRKLSEVMALVEHVPKNGTNPHFHYKYAMESDITQAVRGELAKRQVMLLPSVTSTTFIEGKNAKGNVERIYTITATFTFYDGESGEQIPFTMVGQGSDPSDKGTSKGLTSLVKYALLKAFLIPTGDDPEKEEAAPVYEPPPKPAEPPPPPKPTADDLKLLVDSFAPLGITQADLEKFLGWPLATASGPDMVRLRKHYAEKRAAAKDPDEASRKAVQAAAERELGSAPLRSTPDTTKVFDGFVTKIRAAKTPEEIVLLLSDAMNAKLTKGEVAALNRTGKDHTGLLAQAKARQAAPKQESPDVPF